MPEQSSRERDLILAHTQYAYILDETKGHVVTYVGSTKQSLSATDRPVVYAPDSKRFVQVRLEDAIREFPSADEGCYITLENPTKDAEVHLQPGPNNLPKLNYGRKVNIPGPVSFPLWPGQVAHAVPGHHLRSNQYLVCRVYNEDAARDNWPKSVLKPKAVASVNEEEKTDIVQAEFKPKIRMPDFTMGKLFTIQGTDVSFFIPPTGVEVVPDENVKYVREAITLETLEYCILLDENGNKRFTPGPDVVFPEPTETFVTKDGLRKFRAIELNEDMGIYVKVITDYEDPNGSEHKVGEELFITGKEQRIYFPRPEHAVIRYGDQEMHFSVVIPEGEARYVLNKLTGKIDPVRGPRMFLPDPRKEVVVRRVLDSKTVELLYPGNKEALEYNSRLLLMTQSGKPSEYVTDREVKASSGRDPQFMARSAMLAADVETSRLQADDFRRKTTYTPPRTITLDTKYEGAVSVNIWTGYAVQVVSKTSGRKVVVGPQTVLLEYDESLEVLQLSTGKPKSTDKLENHVYLRVSHNQVSDIVRVVTKDMVQADIKVSYRVNFEGDPNKWFDVENYVKFLTDHMRSMIRNAVKQYGIEEFNNNAINIVRDTVLGAQGQDGKRSGRSFTENGMRIYDVEVLDVKIGDDKIASMLVGAQHEAVGRTIEVARHERNLEVTRRTEVIQQETLKARATTKQVELQISMEQIEKELSVALARVASEVEQVSRRLQANLAQQDDLTRVKEAELIREKSEREQELTFERAKLDQRILELKAEVAAVVDKAKAVSPDFVVALQAFSDRALVEKAAEAMAPMALIGGKSVVEVLSQLLHGSLFGEVVDRTMGKRLGGSVEAR